MRMRFSSEGQSIWVISNRLFFISVWQAVDVISRRSLALDFAVACFDVVEDVFGDQEDCRFPGKGVGLRDHHGIVNLLNSVVSQHLLRRAAAVDVARSEERRVGKEWRS